MFELHNGLIAQLDGVLAFVEQDHARHWLSWLRHVPIFLVCLLVSLLSESLVCAVMYCKILEGYLPGVPGLDNRYFPAYDGR